MSTKGNINVTTFDWLLIVFFMFSVLFSNAQSEFQMGYGSNSSDQGISAIATQDGGYAVTANSYEDLLSTGSVNNLLIKTDDIGAIEWVHVADTNFSNETNIVVEDIVDSSFFVGGYMAGSSLVNYPRGNVWFYNVDKNGNMQWSKVYAGDNNASNSYDEIDDVIRTSDGNFFATGFCDASSYTTGNGAYDATLFKVDRNGNMVWAKSYGTTDYDWGQAIIPTSDGNYLMGGMHSDLSTFDVYMVKIDLAGNVLWANSYGGSGTSQLGSQFANYGNTRPSHSALVETSDGGYVAVGYTNGYGSGGDDMFAIKVNSTGTIVWANTYGTSSNEYASGIVELTGGDLLISGTVTGALASNSNDIFMMRLNASGNLVWGKAYQGSATGGRNEYSGGIAHSGDGHVIITGTVNNSTTNGNDVFLIKTDPNASADTCTTTGIFLPTDQTASVTVVDISSSLTVTAGGSAVAITPVQTSAGNHGAGSLTETTYCYMPVGGPLDIDLLEFNATRKDDKVLLEWATASETENNFFLVERSTDGYRFSEIDMIDGAGTSNALLEYEAYDYTPASGINYYRLKQVDFDGSYTYSEIRAVNFHNILEGVYTYPNPSKAGFTLTLEAQYDTEGAVILMDALGHQIENRSVKLTRGTNQLQINNKLATGIYFLNIVTNDGFQYSVKQIIEK